MDFRTKYKIKILKKKVSKLGGELDVHMIDTKHQNCLWYGGCKAEIKYKEHRLTIEAIGDVISEVADENNEYVGYVKDKNNTGAFYSEFNHFIRDDRHLGELIKNNKIIFSNNNWWECFMYLPDGTFVDTMMCLEADYLSEAIMEVAESMDEILKTGKEK